MRTLKPAVERIADARARHVTATKEIARLVRERREALLADEDDEAERCDAEIEQQRRAAARWADKAELLKPLISIEETERRFPRDMSAARARLQALRAEYARLAKSVGIMHRPTSAETDQKVLELRSEIQLLEQHIERMERFQVGRAAA